MDAQHHCVLSNIQRLSRMYMFMFGHSQTVWLDVILAYFTMLWNNLMNTAEGQDLESLPVCLSASTISLQGVWILKPRQSFKERW